MENKSAPLPVRYCTSCLINSGKHEVATHVARDFQGLDWFVCAKCKDSPTLETRTHQTMEKFWDEVFRSLDPR